MRIGIYREFCSQPALGGAEYCVAVLAEAFERSHDVDIIHNHPGLTAERVEEVFGIALRWTRFRVERDRPAPGGTRRTPWGIYRAAKGHNAQLSRGYDVFISLVHGLPPFCYARLGLLLVLFPGVDWRREWPWHDGAGPGRPALFRVARNAVYDRIWHDRFASYGVKAAISEYTRRWTRACWAIDCDIVYPPVDIPPGPGDVKRPAILSLGRITPSKKQLPLVRRFASMAGEGLAGWSFCCAGGLSDKAEDAAYFEELRRAAGAATVEFAIDPRREEIRALLAGSSLFWHAMGFGEDPEEDPSRMEHFGIATVEAMSQGCVPVVINRGGQPEIVRHGVDGFLWESLEELEGYTRRLVRDAELRGRMAESARIRADRFRKERFVSEVASRCGIPLDATRDPPKLMELNPIDLD